LSHTPLLSCRFLVPIDDRCLLPDELRAWEKGEQSSKTRNIETGAFDPLLASFVAVEKQHLLIDTIDNLGESAMAPVVNSMIDGSLKDHLKVIPQDTREALIRALLVDAPKGFLCDIIECEYHDHAVIRRA
jgi:hypothetical protein